jgi:Bacterial membrane protein YfhO
VIVALWVLVPLLAVHVASWRRPDLRRFQFLVDIGLVLLVARPLLQGAHLGPGVPGAALWGAPHTVVGSPEQTDLPLQLDAWWNEARRLMLQGRAPWTSDRLGAGTPLYAHGQTGIPFPLQLPVWALGAARGTDVMAFWKLELAALGTFFLLASLGVRPAPAATGAVAYAFGGWALAWLVSPVAWVVAATPWVFWALVGTLRGRRRAAAALALLLGVIVGWSVNPESAVFLALAVALAAAVLAWGRCRRIRRLAAPGLLAVLVAGVGAVPTWLTIRDSANLAERGAVQAYPSAGVTWELRGQVAALIATPWREGEPADGTWRLPFPAAAVGLSVGTIALALLASAWPRRRHRRFALAMAAVAIAGAVLFFQLPGFSFLAGKLPVLGTMVWVRAGFLVGFALAMLAALALDAWLRHPRPARLAAATALVQALVVALLLTAPVERLRAWRTAWAPAAIAVAAAIPAAPWAFPLVALAESVSGGWYVVPACAPSPDEPELVRELRLLAKREGGRILGLGSALPPNLAAGAGLADLRDNDPVRSLSLADLHRALGAQGGDLAGPVTRPWSDLAGAWGVRWLVTPPSGVSGRAADGWREVFRDHGGRIYINERCLPVLRVVSAGIVREDRWSRTTPIDYAHAATVEAPLALGGSGIVSSQTMQPDRWSARIRADGDVLAILHVPFAPGWHVTRDGREVRPLLADVAAMAVVVGAGEHEVVWQYTPPGLAAGAIATLTGVLGCVILALPPRRRTV